MDIMVVVFGTLSILFFYAYYKMSKKYYAVSKGLSELFLEYSSVLETKETPDLDDIHKENFIKFLSDSREWAFTYIEDVQSGLKKFIDEVEPEIEYYNNFGIVVEGMIPPHDKAFKKISKEFYELKKLLPENVDDRR